MSKITCTGATGYLGTNLSKSFEDDGFIVKRLGHSEKPAKNNEVMGDVTDSDFTDREVDGDIVIHMAAQKVIPIAEQNPSFSIKNNILGTLNVFQSAIKNGVKEVVFISTDKAQYPETIYGKTKEFGEWLCWYFNRKQTGTKFYACRYGNVAGSAMSVFEVWDKLGKEGKPLKITVPEMTRFFFTIGDAVETVKKTLDAKLTDRPYIPEMKSITMGEAADIFATNYGVSVEVIGNRGMEKIHEDLTDTISSENCERFTREEFIVLLRKIGCL